MKCANSPLESLLPFRARLVLCLTILCLVGAAEAASRLKPMMKTWKSQAEAANAMLSPRGAYDEAKMRAILTGYVSDADELRRRATGTSTAARDFRARLDTFDADASALLASVGQRDQVRAPIGALLAQCKSCHDVHAK